MEGGPPGPAVGAHADSAEADQGVGWRTMVSALQSAASLSPKSVVSGCAVEGRGAPWVGLWGRRQIPRRPPGGWAGGPWCPPSNLPRVSRAREDAPPQALQPVPVQQWLTAFHALKMPV